MANRPMIDAGGMGAREGGSYGWGADPSCTPKGCRPKEASRFDGSVPSRVGLGPGSVGRRWAGSSLPTLADIYVQMQRVHIYIYYTIQGKAVFLH